MSHHLAFYEPRYDKLHPNIWNIRGGNKYPSIIGDLTRRARMSIVMRDLPPADDLLRQRLQNEFGVRFEQLDGWDQHRPECEAQMADELGATLSRIGATIVSNLNGRSMGYCAIMARAARELGIRYVYRVAGNDIESRMVKAASGTRPLAGTRLYEALIRQSRAALHTADRIIVMSRREAVRISGQVVDLDKIEVCFRGVDQTHFYPPPTPREGPCRRFLFVGRQSHEKGYDILEDAAKQLDQSVPDATISFAGTFEPGRAGNRRYLGFHHFAELPDLYRSHDALVLSSRSEGFPQVIMEAMSCGLPCIVSRHLFEQDFVDEDACLLIDAEADAFARALRRMCTDNSLYCRMAENAGRLAATSFSEAVNNLRYCDIVLGAVH